MTASQAPPVDDAEVIVQSLTQPELFAQVYDRHAVAVHRFLARRVGAQLADDLAAQTMLTAFDTRRRFDPAHGSALPWLYGIATNVLRRHARASVRHLRALSKLDPYPLEARHDEDVSDRVSAEAAGRELAAGLAGLNANERDVLLLVAWEGLSYEEVALALSVPLGTVRSRLHRARTKMRTALMEASDDRP
ncbi:RNA polymerase sigma factor [Kutzneria buriramensis]|uniref:RNA polymerase sigma-70 factor (ECF subfamily) n=1 Tax=Kutzneria buriramensis TaxID=1045776 RepID=A0A3E0HYM6_9PSEU|nr:RNA polymerase sigma factor [Kutzneria buriramensis]REH51574.1 RNA polymerase sigma-70 factor (ECF subfamily) [Kutzneria buriramensis]